MVGILENFINVYVHFLFHRIATILSQIQYVFATFSIYVEKRLDWVRISLNLFVSHGILYLFDWWILRMKKIQISDSGNKVTFS